MSKAGSCMSATRLSLFALVIATLFASCHSGADVGEAALSRDAALEIGRKAAIAKGYNLSKYKLDTFGTERSKDQSEWLFVYLCDPGPPPPGCHFLVAVDRKTGKATIHPGE